MRALRICTLLGLVLVLAAPALAAPKKPRPHQPPPPPDTAADCTLVAEAIVTDYVVLAGVDVGVRCDSVKSRIEVRSTLTRDGALLPNIPAVVTRTCTNTSTCFIGWDVFSLDNHPVAFPGDQLYCATGSGLVGGTILGPASACEQDARL